MDRSFRRSFEKMYKKAQAKAMKQTEEKFVMVMINFNEDPRVIEFLREGNYLFAPYPDAIVAKGDIKMCLVNDPNKRPTFGVMKAPESTMKNVITKLEKSNNFTK